MSAKSPRAVVVGAGVIGLTSAVRLLEAGFDVRVLARDFPPHTTSDVAAAVWYPYLAAPRDRVVFWSRATREHLETLVGADAGVSMVRLLELFRRRVDPPWWREALRGFAWVDSATLRHPFVAGYDLRVPVVDTPVHMRWLVAEVSRLGGRTEKTEVRDLAALTDQADVVVHCSGADAGTLTRDPSVVPIRGQIVRVAPVPGVHTALVDEEDPAGPTYVIPRPADIVLGGTAEVGARDPTPDPATAASLLARAERLEPRLRGAQVLGHAVGLRPGRPTVRLERDEDPGRGRILHNYGHGGSGFTLCWGCAADVVDLAKRVMADID